MLKRYINAVFLWCATPQISQLVTLRQLHRFKRLLVQIKASSKYNTYANTQRSRRGASHRARLIYDKFFHIEFGLVGFIVNHVVITVNIFLQGPQAG